jgi:hypothetical protein
MLRTFLCEVDLPTGCQGRKLDIGIGIGTENGREHGKKNRDIDMDIGTKNSREHEKKNRQT